MAASPIATLGTKSTLALSDKQGDERECTHTLSISITSTAPPGLLRTPGRQQCCALRQGSGSSASHPPALLIPALDYPGLSRINRSNQLPKKRTHDVSPDT